MLKERGEKNTEKEVGCNRELYELGGYKLRECERSS